MREMSCPLGFFAHGFKANAAAYTDILGKVVRPWIDRARSGRPYIFEQHSAPSHKARTSQACMSANLHDHALPDTWPPSSPDFNPLGYYVWGVVEREVSQYSHNAIQSLKSAIAKTMSEIDKDHLIWACQRFRPGIEAVIVANGGFTE